MWELLTCAGDIHVWELLMCEMSHQSEILHSLIFDILAGQSTLCPRCIISLDTEDVWLWSTFLSLAF